MHTQSDRLPPALECWGEIRDSYAGRTPALFLDYDGTLTPIVARPELAVLSETMRETVRRLAAKLPVAVVSGRDIKDVRSLVKIDELVYAGSHGYQIEGPGGWRKELDEAARFLSSLKRASEMLEELLGGIPGTLVERKTYSVVAHYRQVAEADVAAVAQAVQHAVAEYPDLRRAAGKKVYELLPDFEWNKGRALLWLCEALKLDGGRYFPVFLGDDITDEHAFAAIEDRGVGILVRDEPRETGAAYALDSVDEVQSFLRQLL